MSAHLSLEAAEIAVPGGPVLFSCGSLEVVPGAFVCLLGPNGSGKSTLLRTLTGLVPPHTGRIMLEGAPLESIPLSLRSRYMTAIFASSSLSPLVSVHDLVSLGRYPYTGARGRLSPEDSRIVEEEIERLDLGHVRKRQLGHLSDGERRRAHIARGLAHRSPLLFLDEALAFLDAVWKQRVLGELTARCQQGGAVVLATQDISEAVSHADRLWLIDPKSRVLRVAGPEDLALSGSINQVFSDGPYHFDAATYRFEAVETSVFYYEMSGDELPAAWTERGLRRAGGRPGSAADAPTGVLRMDVRVERESSGAHRWEYRVRETDNLDAAVGKPPAAGSVSSIAELVEIAMSLRRAR